MFGKCLKILTMLLLVSIPFTAHAWLSVINISGGSNITCTIDNDSLVFDDTGISTASVSTVYGTGVGRIARRFSYTGTITGYKVNATDILLTNGTMIISLHEADGAVGSETIGTVIPGTSVTISYTEITDFPTFSVITKNLTVPKAGLDGTYFLVISTDNEVQPALAQVAYISSSGIRSFIGENYYNGYTIGVGVMGCTE